ncbi:YncE family protein [Actinomadura rupiterrae]|uniref:YncE family protein n=1 Tax=Actinomadura rupiterrae TaxID=559627 RepID=UPI0020A26A97|nr:hypothetical protein [Actinomadura rupiterrae]MCP2335415.1 hypothetical protein [Actinomadura rupiterrae]
MTVPSRSASAAPLHRVAALLGAMAVLTAGCGSPVAFYKPGHGPRNAPVVGLGAPAPYVRPSRRPVPPGPAQDAAGVYAGTTGPSSLARPLRRLPQRLYVPDSRTGGVTVLDARTLRPVGRLRPSPPGPVQLTAAPDLHGLWLNDTTHGAVVPLPPATGRLRRVPTLPTRRPAPPSSSVEAGAVPQVADVRPFARRLPTPGTLYFAPDAQTAFVLSARARSVEVGTAGSDDWTRIPLPCAAGQADFSADASLLAVSCANARRVVRLDPREGRVNASRVLPAGARPAAIRLLPDGSEFAVADAGLGGVWLLNALDFKTARFVRTSPGASALVLSRDARSLYVVGPSGVSVLDVASRQVRARWPVQGDGVLAAGGVSIDGRTLWLTRPASGTLLALDTSTGIASRTVHLPGRPAAPLPFPQPGHRALGGPGIYR